MLTVKKPVKGVGALLIIKLVAYFLAGAVSALLFYSAIGM